MIPEALGMFTSIDQNLVSVSHELGIWVYLLLFSVILLESAIIVVTLPGNSLLFVAGAAAATGLLVFPWLWGVFVLAAFSGYLISYQLGAYLGLNVFQKRFPGIFRDEYIRKTNGYFDSYGGITIMGAPFIPVVRKFAPFIAGISHMMYRRFLIYDLLGAICWATTGLTLGYLLGKIPWIQDAMPLILFIVIIIMVISLLFTASLLIRGRKAPGD
jgi:membrane-associated protein